MHSAGSHDTWGDPVQMDKGRLLSPSAGLFSLPEVKCSVVTVTSVQVNLVKYKLDD